MSEYDYSPEAIERHLATQRRIERWVDNTLEESPSDPFKPLPGEHSTTSHHPQPQPSSLPAFYATPQGVISPTYSNSHRHGHGQRHSPSVIVPQGYRPVMGRSFSTPPLPVRNFYPLPSTPFTSYPTRSLLNPSPFSSPYGSPHHSPYNSPYQPSPMSQTSYSQTSFHSSQIHANPNPIIQHHGGHNYPYVSPPPPQPVVVVRGDKDYVVVAPPGHHVQVIVCCFFPNNVLFIMIHSIIQSPDSAYDSQGGGVNQGQYVFGKLNMKSSRSKRSKRSRRDSY
jgi:hypothetical protein